MISAWNLQLHHKICSTMIPIFKYISSGGPTWCGMYVDRHCNWYSQLSKHGFVSLKKSQWPEMIIVHIANHTHSLYTFFKFLYLLFFQVPNHPAWKSTSVSSVVAVGISKVKCHPTHRKLWNCCSEDAAAHIQCSAVFPSMRNSGIHSDLGFLIKVWGAIYFLVKHEPRSYAKSTSLEDNLALLSFEEFRRV